MIRALRGLEFLFGFPGRNTMGSEWTWPDVVTGIGCAQSVTGEWFEELCSPVLIREGSSMWTAAASEVATPNLVDSMALVIRHRTC